MRRSISHSVAAFITAWGLRLLASKDRSRLDRSHNSSERSSPWPNPNGTAGSTCEGSSGFPSSWAGRRDPPRGDHAAVLEATGVRSSIFTPEHEELRASARAFVERE